MRNGVKVLSQIQDKKKKKRELEGRDSIGTFQVLIKIQCNSLNSKDPNK